MELINTFTVSQPVDRAWAVITDLERVAPCLPGAALLGVEGEDHRGAVTIKVGPVVAQYEGVARFVARADDEHHAVVRAQGRDVRGQGDAAATIDLRLRPLGSGTEVAVVTDLELAGRVAQFGRGVIADVSGKLIGQFVQRLEAEMGREDGATAPSYPTAAAVPAPPASTSAGPGSRARPDLDAVEPVDLLATGSGAVGALFARQALPLAVGLAGLLVGWLLGRARGSGAAPSRGGPGPVITLVLPAAVRTTVPDLEGTP
jgi:carbon monoxide dehydrogenase subunit G